MNLMALKSKIREIPNWPVKGVNFKDITTLLQDQELFEYLIDKLAKPYLNQKIDKVVAIEARGFLLGAPLAYKIKAGISLVRKRGKLPYKTIESNYQKEYGLDTLVIHSDTIKPKEKVIIVDDVLATGGTMQTTVKLVEELGGQIIGICTLIDLPFLGGREKLKKYKLSWLVSYDNE